MLLKYIFLPFTIAIIHLSKADRNFLSRKKWLQISEFKNPQGHEDLASDVDSYEEFDEHISDYDGDDDISEDYVQLGFGERRPCIKKARECLNKNDIKFNCNNL